MAMTKDSKSPVSHLETVYSTYDPSRSVFSPYRSPYTLDLEALQNVIAEVLSMLGNLFTDRDDQDVVVAVVNDDQVILTQRNGTIYMSIRVIMIHFYIIL